MNTELMIDVTEASLESLVRAAYDSSSPRGLGALHYQAGGLSDEQVAEIVGRGNGRIRMDYVNGRSCKFDVIPVGDRRFIKHRWYDHSDGQLRALLKAVGIDESRFDAARAAQDKHDQACLDQALALIRDNGGTYTEPASGWPDEKMDALTGMYIGSERGVIKHDWQNNLQVWKLAA